MALLQSSYSRLTALVSRLNRHYSKTSLIEEGIKKSVFISQSKDVYTNLALEHWLYKNFDFNNHHVLMLWHNDPCLVLGIHQNPWLETNFSELNSVSENGIKLARRKSSGEAIYQDTGSLNLTFFSAQERFNSKYNMEVISRGIFREFGFKIDMNSDEDLLIRNNKLITSKGAKIGRHNSYHNCSLMVKVNKVNQNLALQKHDVDINTNARKNSARVKKMNLCEEIPQISMQSVMKTVGWEFLRTKALSLSDGGIELANQQKGFQLINPTESWFPGLNQIRDKYSSWEWCYGKTPKFNISQTFLVPGDLIHQNTGASANLKVTMTVESGRISDITLYIPYGFSSLGFNGEAKVIHSLKGKKFSVDVFEDFEESLGCLLDEKDKFVTECLKQVMTCA